MRPWLGFFPLFAALALPGASSSAAPASAPAGYVRADGALQIVGWSDLQGAMERVDDLYASAHPGTRFAYASANSLASLYCLTIDATAFAPVSAEFLAGARGAYAIEVRAEPFGIRIAHASLRGGAKLSPFAIVVNRRNPLDHLTTGQVTRIFTAGASPRDLTHWGQAGLGGAWAGREIHPCGLPASDHYPAEDDTFAETMFVHRLGGGSPALRYAAQPDYASVLATVAGDAGAIGITTLNRLSPEVKVVAISGGSWAAPSRGTAEDIGAGRYPYDRYLYLYVRRRPGEALSPLQRDYLRLVLSPPGQAAIAGEAHGYLPLNPLEVGEELAKLE